MTCKPVLVPIHDKTTVSSAIHEKEPVSSNVVQNILRRIATQVLGHAIPNDSIDIQQAFTINQATKQIIYFDPDTRQWSINKEWATDPVL